MTEFRIARTQIPEAHENFGKVKNYEEARTHFIRYKCTKPFFGAFIRCPLHVKPSALRKEPLWYSLVKISRKKDGYVERP